MDAHRRGQCKEPDGLPLLRPDRGLRGHLDGEEGPDRGRKLGRNHPNDAGGGTHHAGLLPAPCGRQLRQRGGGGPAGPDAVRLFRLYVSDGQLLRTGPACGGVHQDSRPRRPRSYRHRHQQRGPGGLSPGPSGHPVPGGDPQDRRQGQDEGHLCGRRVRRVCHSSGAGVKRAERLF